jgi:CheY-like chemotaxis protein/glycine cleavage system H lipoate-binding protein
MVDSREVLIVEDEPVVLKVAGMALHANAIEYREASDVASATELLARNPFKVVVTDLKLPGASGFEILDVVRKMTPRPQVIIITGYATIENALESFQLGSFDFIPKPFDVEELVGVVSRALRFSESPQTDEVVLPNQYFLGRHSWARLEPDGVATLGAAETITSVCGPIGSIDCNDLGDPTTQGECFCRLIGRDGFAHRVWAPLSGQTIALNSKLRDDFETLRREPLAAGWLARVIPSDLEKELVNLSRRHPPGDG